jgi:hypothetical protein
VNPWEDQVMGGDMRSELEDPEEAWVNYSAAVASVGCWGRLSIGIMQLCSGFRRRS